jgi:putative SOS response-associated peptidase YedK
MDGKMTAHAFTSNSLGQYTGRTTVIHLGSTTELSNWWIVPLPTRDFLASARSESPLASIAARSLSAKVPPVRSLDMIAKSRQCRGPGQGLPNRNVIAKILFMCARFTIRAPAAQIAEFFNRPLPFDLRPRYNVAPTQEVLAVRLSPAGEREFVKLRWGLVTSWAKDPKMGQKLINARSETVAEKPSFRSAVNHKRRCLIAADGFYEWKAEGKKKQPYLIRRPNGKPFAFAGLWESWRAEDGQDLESCALLTTEANAKIAPLHDRMPVILTEAADLERWLSADDIAPLLRPAPDGALIFGPANPIVNNPRNEVPECVEPIAP